MKPVSITVLDFFYNLVYILLYNKNINYLSFKKSAVIKASRSIYRFYCIYDLVESTNTFTR